jgi:nitrogen fixation/metabolism regulation signal transduction histidine kinase
VTRIARLVDDMRQLFDDPEASAESVDLEALVDDAVRDAEIDRRGGPRVVVSTEGRLSPIRGSGERSDPGRRPSARQCAPGAGGLA